MRAALFVAGIVLIAAGLVRRHQLLRRRARALDRMLDDDAPDVRAGALEEIAAVGLRPFGSQLLRRTARLDPASAEVAELLSVVERCQWEPADDPTVVGLRQWASSVAESQPRPSPPSPRRVPFAPVDHSRTAAAVELVAEALGIPVDAVRVRLFRGG